MRARVAYSALAVPMLLAGWFWRSPTVPDALLFARSGAAILSGHGHEVYSDDGVQAGPFQLLLFAVLHGLDGVLPEFLAPPHAQAFNAPGLVLGPGLGLFYLLGTPLAGLSAAAGVRWLRIQAGRRPSLIVEMTAGVLVVLFGAGDSVLSSGHPAEGVIPVIWVLAGLAARRNRALLAGVLIGLSAGWEVWGVLGIAVLLLTPTGSIGTRSAVRSAGRGLGALAGTIAALYLPFVVAGPFRMFQHQWPISSGTLVHALFPQAESFTWWMRVLQAFLAIAVSAAVAARIRLQPDAVWLIPLTATSTRLVLDPVGYDYYWTAPLILVTLGAACAKTSLEQAIWVAFMLWQVLPGGRTPLGTVPLVLACAAIKVRPGRTTSDAARGPWAGPGGDGSGRAVPAG